MTLETSLRSTSKNPGRIINCTSWATTSWSHVFLGDSEIILRMIANGDPAAPPVFYGTKTIEIAAQPNQTTGSGVLDPSTPLIYSPEPVLPVHKSSLIFGCMGVSSLNLKVPGWSKNVHLSSPTPYLPYPSTSRSPRRSTHPPTSSSASKTQ